MGAIIKHPNEIDGWDNIKISAPSFIMDVEYSLVGDNNWDLEIYFMVKNALDCGLIVWAF